MVRFVIVVMALSMSLLYCGCAYNAKLINSMKSSNRQDVFQDLFETSSIQPGYSDIKIVASFKTHKPGEYIYGSKVRGTPEYKLLMNIDGQAVLLRGLTREEENYDQNHQDSEVGIGIRYLFNRSIRLKAGKHKIFFALPEDEVMVERDIVLKDGSSNELMLEPIYSSTTGLAKHKVFNFSAGINGFWLKLNGKYL